MDAYTFAGSICPLLGYFSIDDGGGWWEWIEMTREKEVGCWHVVVDR